MPALPSHRLKIPRIKALVALAILAMALVMLSGDSKDVGLEAERLDGSKASGVALLERCKATCKKPLLDPKVETGSRSDRLNQRLVSMVVKLALLREDLSHILEHFESGKTGMSRIQEEALAKARQTPETVGATVMRAPEAAVAAYALAGEPDDATSRIVIPIGDNQQVTLVRTSMERTDKGVIWRGTVEDSGERAVLLWWRDGRLTGEFSREGHVYTVMNIGGDLRAMLESEPSVLPPDHPDNFSEPYPSDGRDALPNVVPISADELKTLESKKIVIDVMMLYTKRAASHYMRDPTDVLQLAIERVNETFRNSALGNISLRLVHTQAVDYDEQGSEEFTDLYRMVDGDEPFKDVRRLRAEKHAAIVGMVVDDPRGCGLSTRVAPDAEEAYFVVHYSCAAIALSIAHEIGHILGARHDRQSDPDNTPFPYGHGYINGTKWRDIMSYPEGCNGCPRLPFWSNPRVLYKGEPTGTLTEDNARVILEQAERVSNFAKRGPDG